MASAPSFVSSTTCSPRTKFPPLSFLSRCFSFPCLIRSGISQPQHVAPLSPSQDPKLVIKSSIPYKSHPQLPFIREQSHSWFRQYASLPHIEAADFALLLSSTVPCGDAHMVSNLIKFFLFLVPLDDMIDTLPVSKSTSRDSIIDHVMAILQEKAFQLEINEFPLIRACADVCGNIHQHTTPRQWQCFVEGVMAYLDGLKEQTQIFCLPNSPPPNLSTYTSIRRKVIGGTMVYPLMQAILDMEVDAKLWEEEHFQNLKNLVSNYCIFNNDVLSFHEEEGIIWNVVSILKATDGCTLREAVSLSCQKMEATEHEFKDRLQDFKASLTKRQSKLMLYLDVLESHFPGHLLWSGKSIRYGNRHHIHNDGKGVILELNYDFLA